MPRKLFSFWFIIVPHVLLLYAALILSLYLRYPGGIDEATRRAHFEAFSIIFALWMLVFYIHGLFEVGTFRRYTTLLVNLVSATIVNVLVAIIYFYIQPNFILTPRRFLLIDVAISFGLLLVWNLIVKAVLKNRIFEGVYLLAGDTATEMLAQEIEYHDYLGYRVLGKVGETELAALSLQKNSSVIVPDTLHANPALSQALYNLRTSGVNFYNYKNFYEFLLRRIYLSDLNELWFLENINYREKRFYNLMKRLVDIAFGSVFFLAFLVSYPFFAVLIKLESSGPVLFTQNRVGRNGEVFKIYKYRTMSGGRTDTWTAKNDPRITRLGNILRKTRIDELPQSINLLRGDLSLVGPRPEQVHIVQQLRQDIPFYDERHLVKPGITGWAQLNIYAGSLEETKLKLQYDLYYIKHRSFLFDLEIILKTIYYIFTWQGR